MFILNRNLFGITPTLPPTTSPADPIVSLPRVRGRPTLVQLGRRRGSLHGIEPGGIRNCDRTRNRGLIFCCDSCSLRGRSTNTGEVMVFVTSSTLLVVSFAVLLPAVGATVSRVLFATMLAFSERQGFVLVMVKSLLLLSSKESGRHSWTLSCHKEPGTTVSHLPAQKH